MKKIALCFMALALILVGCTKEESNEPKTTYTFSTAEGTIEQMIAMLIEEGYYNARLEVLFSEYGEGHRISFNNIDSAIDNKKYSFIAHDKAEYVTVKLELTAEHNLYGDFEYIRYLANVIYLEKDANTDIIFYTDSMVSKTEPK